MKADLTSALLKHSTDSRDKAVLDLDVATLENMLSRLDSSLNHAVLAAQVRDSDAREAIAKAYNLVNEAKLILERESAKLQIKVVEFELDRATAEK